MGLLKRVFGVGQKKKDKNAAPSPQGAVQKLLDIEAILLKKQLYLESKIQNEIAVAKKQALKNKRLAIQALGRKRMLEKQLAHIDGTLQQIENQRSALENAATNAEVMKIMSETTKSLAAAHKNLDIDKVNELMEAVHAEQEVANELANAISNPMGTTASMDVDSLMKELEQLELDVENNVVSTVSDTSYSPISVEDVLPSAPTANPTMKEDVEFEKQLADLVKWSAS